MGSDDNVNTTATWENGAALDYEVFFADAGTYYVWMRVYGPNGAANSAFFSFADQPTTAAFNNQNSTPPWTWVTGAPVEISSPGSYTFRMVVREDGYGVDRIVLASDSAYQPATANGGAGPDASPKRRPDPRRDFAAWRDQYQWPEGHNNPLDDPDGDGICNVWEMFLNRDPHQADVRSLLRPEFVKQGDHVLRWVIYPADDTRQQLKLYSGSTPGVWDSSEIVYPEAEASLLPSTSVEVGLDEDGTVTIIKQLSGDRQFFRFELITE